MIYGMQSYMLHRWSFLRGIHRWSMDFPRKAPVIRNFTTSIIISATIHRPHEFHSQSIWPNTARSICLLLTYNWIILLLQDTPCKRDWLNSRDFVISYWSGLTSGFMTQFFPSMGLLPDVYSCGLSMRRECRDVFPDTDFKETTS